VYKQVNYFNNYKLRIIVKLDKPFNFSKLLSYAYLGYHLGAGPSC